MARNLVGGAVDRFPTATNGRCEIDHRTRWGTETDVHDHRNTEESQRCEPQPRWVINQHTTEKRDHSGSGEWHAESGGQSARPGPFARHSATVEDPDGSLQGRTEGIGLRCQVRRSDSAAVPAMSPMPVPNGTSHPGPRLPVPSGNSAGTFEGHGCPTEAALLDRVGHLHGRRSRTRRGSARLGRHRHRPRRGLRSLHRPRCRRNRGQSGIYVNGAARVSSPHTGSAT